MVEQNGIYEVTGFYLLVVCFSTYVDVDMKNDHPCVTYSQFMCHYVDIFTTFWSSYKFDSEFRGKLVSLAVV